MMSFSSHFHGKVDQESDCYLMGIDMHLCRGHMSMSDVALMVVDECHHTVGNHSYAKIMDQHYHRVAAKESKQLSYSTCLDPGKEEWASCSKGPWSQCESGDQSSEAGGRVSHCESQVGADVRRRG